MRAHACDRCKRRKVRCNGADPCSQCSQGNSPCERRTALRRPGPRVAKRPIEDAPSYPSLSSPPAYSPVTVRSLVHPVYSPPAVVLSPGLSPASSISTAPSALLAELARIQSSLNTRFHALEGCSSTSLGEVAHGCVDLFMQFLFPNTPIAHEPTLRECVPLLSQSPSTSDAPLSVVRRFTLIIALCAHIISVVPETLSRRPKELSIIFFDASRSMLRAYESLDLENPDSTSLTIRMWHSSCAQNTTGKVGASWHYHTEACCLAQRLRLYDEEEISKVAAAASRPLLESRLLRNNFWHLYLAEKTNVAFRTRPPIIDERICYGGITLTEGEESEIETTPLLDTSLGRNRASLEKRILVGFHLRRRISAMAAALIEDVAACSRRRAKGKTDADDDDPEVTGLVERYLHFAALVNQVPPWVMHPDRDNNPDVTDENTRGYHTTCFWAQRSNILTIFHCMRLLILQACIDHGLTVVVGLPPTSKLAWSSRKLEIVRDFLYDLQATPFVCLEAQGETTVDKVRRVGTILLELLHTSDNATIKAQADTLFKSLLDMLSRLDSKACEGLEEESGGWRDGGEATTVP